MNGIIIYVNLNQMKKYLNGEEFKGWATRWDNSDQHLTTEMLVQPEHVVHMEKVEQGGYLRLRYTVNIKKRLEL